jgi:zinc protease
MAKVEAAIAEEIERASKEGFTPDEIAKAQSGLRQQRLQGRTRDANLAGAWTQNLYLKRTFRRSQELDEALDKLGAPQVNAAFAKYIRLADLSVVTALDEVKAATGSISAVAIPN